MYLYAYEATCIKFLLIQSIALTGNSVFFLTLTIIFLVFRDSQNENSQLKYAQRELLDKLEAQQKEFDTKQLVSSAQSKWEMIQF